MSQLDDILENITWVFDKQNQTLIVESDGIAPKAAKQKIKSLMLEIIGNNVDIPDDTDPNYALVMAAQNVLREDLRKVVKKL